MSTHDKLLAKLGKLDAVFTWPELVRLLKGLGFTQIEGSGSRVKFDHKTANVLINLHKPHPGKEIKAYMRRQLIEHLKAQGWMK